MGALSKYICGAFGDIADPHSILISTLLFHFQTKMTLPAMKVHTDSFVRFLASGVFKYFKKLHILPNFNWGQKSNGGDCRKFVLFSDIVMIWKSMRANNTKNFRLNHEGAERKL